MLLVNPRKSSHTVSASEPVSEWLLALLVRRAAVSVLNREDLNDASRWKAGAPTVFSSVVIKAKKEHKETGRRQKRGKRVAVSRRVMRALRWSGGRRVGRLMQWVPRPWTGGLWEWVVAIGRA